MIELLDDRLRISFPEVHPGARCSIEFQRTLRIPDDNREHFLPPGLGCFPLKHVDDYATKLPPLWGNRAGVFLPMYQAESVWLNFHSEFPFAIKVAAGKINAVTGEQWSNTLSSNPQDYLVTPEQAWLDGFCVAEGKIRQFVAMPLGSGYTAEEQLTGEAEHGGLQLLLMPMKREVFERIGRARRTFAAEHGAPVASVARLEEMGLAPGGLMRQQIFVDSYGIDAWDTTSISRCFVHILNSAQYLAVTGYAPPTVPPTAEAYSKAGLPWFEYYAADLASLKGAQKLAGLDSVAAKGIKKGGDSALPENDPVNEAQVKVLSPKNKTLREGIW
jgi:hypothetical protein